MSLARGALHVTKAIAASVAVVVVFVVALVGAVILHLGTGPVRRVVARELPVLLDGAFPGKLRVHALGALSLEGVGGVDVDLVHPDGEVVAHLRRVEATLDPVRALKAFLGSGPIEIPIRSVAVDSLDIDVSMKNGNLRIADVFVDPNEQTEPEEPGSRALEVSIREIAVGHAWAYGRIEADGPVVDVDLDDLLASFALDDDTTRIGLTRVDLTTRQAPRGADVRGRLSAAFDMTSKPTGERPAQSAFYFLHGTAARSPISTIGILRGDALHAFVWLPEITPAQVRDVAPEAPPIGETVGLTVVADGTFDRIAARVLAAAGRSRLDVAADAVLAPSLAVTARVHADDLDAALVGGPSTSVSLDAEGDVAIPDGGEPRGKAKLTTQPGMVDGIPVPAIAGQGTFAGESAHAALDVREPGMRASVVADVKPGPKGQIVDATIDVPRAELAALKRRGFQAAGVAAVKGQAHLDLGAETMAATLKVDASNLSAEKAPGVTVGSLRLEARAEGPLANPNVKADAHVRDVTAAERDVRWATVAVTGAAMQPLVVVEVSSLDFPSVRARARVDVRGGPALDDIQVEAKRGTTTARLAVGHVVLGSGIPAVRDAHLEGLGAPMVFSVTPEGQRGTRIVAKAPRISIPAAMELAALDVGVQDGRVGLDTDVLVGATRLDGRIRIDVQEVDLQRGGLAMNDIDLSVLAEVRGREVRFSVDSESTAIGVVHVRSTRTVELGGPPMEAGSWRDAVGALSLDGDVRLASIVRLIPRDMLPVQDVEGHLVFRGEVSRDAVTSAPAADLSLETRELAVIGKPSGAKTEPVRPELLASYQPAEPRQSRDRLFTPDTRPPARHGNKPDPTPVPAFTLRGVDLSAHVLAKPQPGRLELTARARDVHGDLVKTAIGADLEYGGMLRGEPIEMAKLENVPLVATVSIPSRKIANLPPVLGVPSTAGNIALDVKLDGTLKRPKVAVDGALAQLSIEGSPLEEPFVVKLKADYDGERASAHVALDQQGKRLLKATSTATVALRDVLHPQAGKELPWNASADVRLGPLPLDVLEAVLPTQIDGIATGHVKVTDLHRNASLDADVSVDGLVLGGIPHREAKVVIAAKDGKLTGKVRMAQPDGSLDADAEVGIAWGARLVPELRATDDFDVGVRARKFRLRAAEPFLTSVLNRLDGRLDGDVRLSKEVLTEAAKGRGVKGQLALTRGSIEVAAGGGPLEDVRATVRVGDDGMVRLDDVFARGASGEVRAVGVAAFGNAGFQAARLNVVIPEKKPMPLLLSGEHLADVSANVKVSADMVDKGRELRVGIDIPRLQVELPDSLPDGVQTLDDIEQVRIGTMRRGRFIPLAVDAPDAPTAASGSTFRTRLDIALRNARIVKGDMLSTYVRGNPSLLIDGDKTVMSGSVKLAGGRVDIKGRRFEIESGTITFTGDPANPNVVLTAKWKAPDDTWIYADFVGPVQTGKVNLRSDPPRSREEILALVIFGRAEGYSSGGQQADKGTQAVGMAGGFATEGLNKVLDDVTDLEIRTRVDTSSSSNPRPELEVQISQAIAARIAYVLGELAPGQSPDRTYATIDWNFRPEWSLETTVGDKQSTTLDMIWERRY